MTISSSKNFSPLRSSISPRNQVQIRWFLIPWNRFKVLFHNLPFSPISIINSSSDLINFEDYIKNFLISLLIRPLFTIIPFNSIHFHQIGKFGNIFDTRPCEINDLAVPYRQSPKEVFMVLAYGFNRHHLFDGTYKDYISTIYSKEPLSLAYKRIFFFLYFSSFLDLS